MLKYSTDVYFIPITSNINSIYGQYFLFTFVRSHLRIATSCGNGRSRSTKLTLALFHTYTQSLSHTHAHTHSCRHIHTPTTHTPTTHTQTHTKHTPTHTHTHIHMHIHTHTLTWICGVRSLSIGIMVFLMYKLYNLSPYTNPTPKPTNHRQLLAFF